MSLFSIAPGNILGSLLYALSQGIGSKHFGIGAETEECAYQPVIFCRWAAKTEQSSILTKWLNSVAQLWITLHNQNPTGGELDTYFCM